jgi:hypothetical protein
VRGRGGPDGVVSASRGKADDVVPGGEAGGHFSAVDIGAQPVAAGWKCGDIPLNADRNRCAWPGGVKRFIARSRARAGWWEFSARLFRYLDRRCSTPGISRRWATP